MSYYKRVIYADHYSNGEKVGNAGFVKLMKMNDGGGNRTCLQVHIMNLPRQQTSQGTVKLVLEKREYLLGQMNIVGGRGMMQVKHVEEMLKENGSDWDKQENARIVVEINPGETIRCDLRGDQPGGNGRREPDSENGNKEVSNLENGNLENSNRQNGNLVNDNRENGNLVSDNRKEGTPEEVVQGQEFTERYSETRETEISEMESAARQEIEKTEAGFRESKPEETDRKVHSTKRQMYPERGGRMKKDKWSQIWEMLPHIRPFGDDREYLRIGLQDMLILSGKYYRLVENSFLLHGFYNYEHLIMTRMCRRGMEKYYIGVPGNYYEREKQVAVWFGFESFEPKAEPATEGDFGYYMISVDI